MIFFAKWVWDTNEAEIWRVEGFSVSFLGKLIVESDSKNVIYWLLAAGMLHGSIASYWLSFEEFRKHFQVEFHHVLREANEVVDLLAKQGVLKKGKYLAALL